MKILNRKIGYTLPIQKFYVEYVKQYWSMYNSATMWVILSHRSEFISLKWSKQVACLKQAFNLADWKHIRAGSPIYRPVLRWHPILWFRWIWKWTPFHTCLSHAWETSRSKCFWKGKWNWGLNTSITPNNKSKKKTWLYLPRSHVHRQVDHLVVIGSLLSR